MNCTNGNSYELDGYKFIEKDINKDLHGMYKLTTELLNITIKDFLDGYTLAGVCDSIILYCIIMQRLNETKVK